MNAQAAVSAASEPAASAVSYDEGQHWAEGESPAVLSEIYRPEINLSYWRRQVDAEVEDYAALLVAHPTFTSLSAVLQADAVAAWLESHLPEHPAHQAFVDDIALLADMFTYLFELPRLALRLHSLNKPMCPRFHVDKVPCRLVTTYVGNPTEWLDNRCIDRQRLGRGSEGKPDESSGLIARHAEVLSVPAQSVVLLKGEGWWENEGRGVVHRSPAASSENPRLFLSFDFAD